MTRRGFGHILAGVGVAAPSMAIAQSSGGVRRIGVLSPGMPTPEEIRQFGEGLRELGWAEGRNLRVERRYSNNQIEPLQSLADELVRAKVELIVTVGFSATLAAKRATTTIPIVFLSTYDPVASGFVASLARPGSNLTGLSDAGPEIAAKYLALLKELLPLQRIAVIGLPTPLWRATREQYADSCRSLGIEPIFVVVAAANEIPGAVARVAQQRPQALVLRADSFVFTHRFEIVDAASTSRLATPPLGSVCSRIHPKRTPPTGAKARCRRFLTTACPRVHSHASRLCKPDRGGLRRDAEDHSKTDCGRSGWRR